MGTILSKDSTWCDLHHRYFSVTMFCKKCTSSVHKLYHTRLTFVGENLDFYKTKTTERTD